jgi:hypothetical protein
VASMCEGFHLYEQTHPFLGGGGEEDRTRFTQQYTTTTEERRHRRDTQRETRVDISVLGCIYMAR